MTMSFSYRGWMFTASLTARTQGNVDYWDYVITNDQNSDTFSGSVQQREFNPVDELAGMEDTLIQYANQYIDANGGTI